MNMIEQLEAEEVARVTAGKTIPEFSPGDTLSVNVRIKEGERERVQRYEGVCIARAGQGINENFTVRKISFGEGVERVFPVVSPMIESIEVKRKGRVKAAFAAPSFTICAIAVVNLLVLLSGQLATVWKCLKSQLPRPSSGCRNRCF